MVPPPAAPTAPDLFERWRVGERKQTLDVEASLSTPALIGGAKHVILATVDKSNLLWETEGESFRNGGF